MALPLQQFEVLHSSNADEVQERVSRAYCRHQLTPVAARPLLDAHYHRVSFGDISFNFLHYGADVTVRPGIFDRFLMIEVPLRGTAHIHYGDQTVISGGNIGAVISATKPVYSRWSADADRLMVQVDRGSLERFATTVVGHHLVRPLEFQLALNLRDDIGAGLRAYIHYVVDQLCNNDLFTRYPLVRQQVSRTVFMMLLNGQPHTYSDEIRAVATPGAPIHIERAYQYIMVHYDKEITIEELVETSGVSMRSLYAGFKRYKGVSPMAALKNRRLEAAREDLLRADPANSVTSVALKWGFEHLGNFSGDYFRRFGEHPSETLRNSLR